MIGGLPNDDPLASLAETPHEGTEPGIMYKGGREDMGGGEML